MQMDAKLSKGIRSPITRLRHQSSKNRQLASQIRRGRNTDDLVLEDLEVYPEPYGTDPVL